MPPGVPRDDHDNRLCMLYPERRQQRNLAMTVIQLPDDQAAALKARAAAQGLTPILFT